MDTTLLQYGALGVLALASMTVSIVLWKHILTLQKQLIELVARYEKLVTKLVEKEAVLERSLEDLQEGLAAKDLLSQYLEKMQNTRK